MERKRWSRTGPSTYNPNFLRCDPSWECGGRFHADSRTYRKHRDRYAASASSVRGAGAARVFQRTTLGRITKKRTPRARQTREFRIEQCATRISKVSSVENQVSTPDSSRKSPNVNASGSNTDDGCSEVEVEDIFGSPGGDEMNRRTDNLEEWEDDGLPQGDGEVLPLTFSESSASRSSVFEEEEEDAPGLASTGGLRFSENMDIFLVEKRQRSMISDEEDVLLLLEWQARRGITNAALRELIENVLPRLDGSQLSRILERAQNRDLTLFKMNRRLMRASNYFPLLVDCCINGCVAYSGERETERQCSYCGEKRHDSVGRARKQFKYFPLIPRLAAQLESGATWVEMGYRHEEAYSWDSAEAVRNNVMRDYFDGALYITLDRIYNFGRDDVLFSFSTDGKQLFRSKPDDAWPLLLINLNLPPRLRYKVENLITLGLIPGPRAPKCIESFFHPMIEEFKRLERGVWLKRSSSNHLIFVRAFIIFITGDLPALQKLCCIKGHNGLSPCRFCRIHGFHNSKGVYFPSRLEPWEDGRLAKREAVHQGTIVWPYDPRDLPLRSHLQTLRFIEELKSLPTAKDRAEESKLSGIKGSPSFSRLSSVRLFDSFPVDIMHLLYLNIAKHMFRLWTGEYILAMEEEGFILSKRVWKDIGREMEEASRLLPQSFGRRPRNIERYAGSFKAEEWRLWVIHYSLPLLRGRLEKVYCDGWKVFVKLCVLCEQKTVTLAAIEEMKRTAIAFFNHYERDYALYKPERATLMKYVFHCMLHLGDSTYAAGPLTGVSQYPMERFIGTLTPYIRTTRDAIENISQTLLTLERLKISKLLFPVRHVSLKHVKSREHVSTNIRFQPDVEEQPEYENFALLGPKEDGQLSPSAMRLLKNFYLKKDIDLTNFEPNNCVTYWRRLEILTPGGFFADAVHVSTMGYDNPRCSRPRNFVAATFLDSCDCETRTTYYGSVEKLFLHTYQGTKSMLALICWARYQRKKSDGVISYSTPLRRTFCESRTIESVEVIRRPVGIIERAQREGVRKKYDTFVLDKDLEALLDNHGVGGI